jgi:hypothetical protein
VLAVVVGLLFASGSSYVAPVYQEELLVVIVAVAITLLIYKDRKKLEEDIEGRRLSTSWKIVLAFFLGAAVSSIAEDPSDTIFFYASSHHLITTATEQTFYWYIVPFFVYISLFFLGVLLARTHRMDASFLLYLFLFLVLFSTIISLSLPQTSSLIYIAVVVAGTVISIGSIVGVKEEIE